MTTTLRRTWTGTLVLLTALLASFTPTLAQPEPDAPAAQEPAREQTIYIPYEKLREVFERQGRGVFVPYEQFMELWQLARRPADAAPDDQPPVAALITETINEATLTGDAVRVQAQVKIDVLQRGWVRVPLRLRDAAITSATLAGEPARIVHDADTGYALLHEHTDAQPATITLDLTYARAVDKAPGRNRVAFEAPQAPVSRWRLTIPEPGVEVNIQPLIAATQMPAETSAASPADQTVVLAFVGAAPQVSIEWQPKAEGAAGLTALAQVQAQQQVWIEEGLVRARADLAWAISRAQLDRLAVDVPAAYKVANVADANVRQWRVEPSADGAQQRVVIELFEPARTQQRVMIELERFVEGAAQSQVAVPVVSAVDVGRQQGVVVIHASDALRTEVVRASGLTQVDSAELPGALRRGDWTLAYRYAATPFDLVLDVEKIQPTIIADVLTRAYLQPETLRLDVAAVYDVQRAGVFELAVTLPEGFEVRRVSGRAVGDAQPAEVDTHHETDTADGRQLVVNLSKRALGKVALGVELVRRLDDPNLLAPTGRPSTLELAPPRGVSTHLQRQSGRLVLHAPEALRLTAEQTAGLRPVPVDEALGAMKQAAAATDAALQPVLAFAWSQDAPHLRLTAERRQPQVTVRQLLVARIEPGVVRYEATFFYDVRYSGVKSLRIDLPRAIAPDVRNVTPGVRDRAIEPAPDDLAADDVAWRFTGEREFLGDATLRLTWERRLDKLDVGSSIDLPTPKLTPCGVDRAWGQVVLVKAETIDVRPAQSPRNVRPIDPQHDLMQGASVPNAARAFEFHDEAWALTVTATHYELEAVKRTSIERAVVRMVVTRSDQVAVQAIYRMRSARQRLETNLPAGATFDTDPLRINGRSVPLERSGQGRYLVPLVSQPADEPFVLELRYTLDAAAGLELPVFPDEPAEQKVYLSVYLPPERTVLAARGPWTPEMQWQLDPLRGWSPHATRSDEALIQWATQGIGVNANLTDSLQTDGRRYLYSSLRPAPPPDGSLRMTTMRQTLLSVLVFAVLVLCGLALLPAGAAKRWLAIGALLVALVLVGVFAPTFAYQVMDAVLLAAVAVVLIVWAVDYLARQRPRRAKPEPAPAAAIEGGQADA